jgi:LPXTG-motif cell wall-anchored protein
MTYEYMDGMGYLPDNYLGSGTGRVLELAAQIQQLKRAAGGTASNAVNQQSRVEASLTDSRSDEEVLQASQYEINAHIGMVNGLIERARSGAADAVQQLRDFVTHHDTQQTMAAFQNPSSAARGFRLLHSQDPALLNRYRTTIETAQAIVEGRDPGPTASGNGERQNAIVTTGEESNNTGLLIGVGVGGAVAVAALGYFLWRRGR